MTCSSRRYATWRATPTANRFGAAERLGALPRQGEGQVHQRAGGDAACPLYPGALVLIEVVGGRHVYVDPAAVLREVVEELGGADRPAVSVADVLDIGDGALQRLAVLVDEGEAPHSLAGRLAGLDQGGGQGVVSGHEAGGRRAQGDLHRTGQGGHVDYR